MLRFTAIVLLGSGMLCAQARFEVASIKPADPDAHGTSTMTDKVGGLNSTNLPVRALITMAYGIRDFQLSGGPGWIGTERYDIIAKPDRAESAPVPADIHDMTDQQRKVRDDQWKERVRALTALKTPKSYLAPFWANITSCRAANKSCWKAAPEQEKCSDLF